MKAADIKDDLASGRVVQVRGLRWVISDVEPFTSPDTGANRGATSTLVDLQSIEDDRFNESLSVIWEVEPDALILPKSSLPDPPPEPIMLACAT